MDILQNKVRSLCHLSTAIENNRFLVPILIVRVCESLRNTISLELRQYKNSSTQSRNFLVLKLPRFFVTNVVSEKGGNVKTKKILKELSRS